MKKWITGLLAASVLLMAAGCGGTAERPAAAEPSSIEEEVPPANNAEQETAVSSSDENAAAKDMSQPEEPDSGTSAGQMREPGAVLENASVTGNEQPASPSEAASSPAVSPVAAPEPEASRILIAYFTWADNTVVEDPDAAIQGALDHYESIGDASRYEGVDATSSASVVVPGNAAKIAAWIQQEVGGDLFSIVVTEPYSSDYDECLDRAADEKADNARPALSTHVTNMEDYDIVFLGFPNWWYTLPMPVLSFVDEYDFSGKTIVPFCTHGTGGLSNTIRDLTAALPDDVTVLDAIGIYRPDVDSSRPAVQDWIAGLELGI